MYLAPFMVATIFFMMFCNIFVHRKFSQFSNLELTGHPLSPVKHLYVTLGKLRAEQDCIKNIIAEVRRMKGKWKLIHYKKKTKNFVTGTQS